MVRPSRASRISSHTWRTIAWVTGFVSVRATPSAMNRDSSSGVRNAPTTTTGTGSVIGSSSNASTRKPARLLVVGVDEDQVGRVGARAGWRARPARLRCARTPERANANGRLFGERVGERLAADDEHGDGREARALVGRAHPIFGELFEFFGDGGCGFARGRLAPGERRKIVEDFADEGDLGFAEAASLRAAIEDGEDLLEPASHRFEAQQARAPEPRAHGGAAGARSRATLDDGSSSRPDREVARVVQLATERGDEISPRATQPASGGVPGFGRATRHDPPRP